MSKYAKIYLLLSLMFTCLFAAVGVYIDYRDSHYTEPEIAKTNTVFGMDFDPSQPGYVICRWNPDGARLECMPLDHSLKELTQNNSQEL